MICFIIVISLLLFVWSYAIVKLAIFLFYFSKACILVLLEWHKKRKAETNEYRQFLKNLNHLLKN